jgi:hypothetical protein
MTTARSLIPLQEQTWVKVVGNIRSFAGGRQYVKLAFFVLTLFQHHGLQDMGLGR